MKAEQISGAGIDIYNSFLKDFRIKLRKSQRRCTDRFQSFLRDHFGGRAVFLAPAVKSSAAPNDPIRSCFAAVVLAAACAANSSREYGFSPLDGIASLRLLLQSKLDGLKLLSADDRLMVVFHPIYRKFTVVDDFLFGKVVTHENFL